MSLLLLLNGLPPAPVVKVTLPYTETFPGADGSTWPNVWTQHDGGSLGTVDIRSGAGHIIPSTGSYGTTYSSLNMPEMGDTDITGTVIAANLQGEQYALVAINTNNAFNVYQPDTGYVLMIWGTDGHTTLGLYQEKAGVETELVKSGALPSSSPVTKQAFRFQRIGKTLRARLWDASTAEPAVWTLTYQLTGSPFTGNVALGVQRGDTYPAEYSFDDVTIANPIIPLPYTETFPGADGSSWPSPWNKVSGIATIQSGFGRITPDSTTVYSAARQDLIALGSSGDTDIVYTVTPVTAGGEQYATTTINGDASGTGDGPLNGYEFILSLSATPNAVGLQIRLMSNGTKTDPPSASLTKIIGGSTYNVRFQRYGQVLNAKVWALGSSEPNTWDVTYTLTGTPLTGIVSIGVSNGNDLTPRPFHYDNLTISVSQPPVTVIPTTGLIKVWNGTTWTAKPVKIWNGSAWIIKPVKVWNGTTWATTGTSSGGGGGGGGGTAQSATLALTGAGSNAIGWNAEGAPVYTLLTSDDGGATKIYSPTAGDFVTYQLADLPGSASTVASVTVHASCYKLDPVSANIHVVVWINGTAYESSDLIPASNTSYEDLSYTWTKNPATGTAWTPAAVNAMEIGIKKIDSAGERCSYLAAVVAYA